MPGFNSDDVTGNFVSPGGFVFGVQGWTWGEQRPMSITFFLDGTAKVSDQHGRPIKGTVKDGRPVYFDKSTHAQVIAALADERVDWQNLTCAGWPQLPYEELQKVKLLPPTPVEELSKIPNTRLRADALRIKREMEEARVTESQAVQDEV
jgi:hypothetical protein